MSYELEIQKSHPSVFDSYDGGSPPLVAGSGSSTLLSVADSNSFLAYAEDTEGVPFSLEVWYLPVDVTSPVVVIGHPDEGVMFDGSVFTLSIENGRVITSGSWTPSEIGTFHIAFVYNLLNYSLYINGDLVINLDVPVGPFDSTDNTIVVNSGSGTGIYDSLALYYRPLSPAEIKSHYSLGRDILTAAEIASSHGGTTYFLTYDNVDIAQSFVYDSSNWTTGFNSGLTLTDNLEAIGAGEWSVSIPIESISDGTTAGVNLSATGVGFTIQYSLDATTWTYVDNNTTILQDSSTVGVMLYLKLVVADGGYVEQFKVDVLEDRILHPFAGNRTLTFYNASFDKKAENQLDYKVDQGAKITQGYVEVGIDPEVAPVNIGTVSAWLKFAGDTGWVLANSGTAFVSLTANALDSTGIDMYMNGHPIADGTTAPVDQWAFYTFVFTTPNNTSIRLGAKKANTDYLDMSVGNVAVYPQSMSAADALELYNVNVGAPSLSVVDSGVIGVTETDPAVDLFAYVWTV